MPLIARSVSSVPGEERFFPRARTRLAGPLPRLFLPSRLCQPHSSHKAILQLGSGSSFWRHGAPSRQSRSAESQTSVASPAFSSEVCCKKRSRAAGTAGQGGPGGVSPSWSWLRRSQQGASRLWPSSKPLLPAEDRQQGQRGQEPVNSKDSERGLWASSSHSWEPRVPERPQGGPGPWSGC